MYQYPIITFQALDQLNGCSAHNVIQMSAWWDCELVIWGWTLAQVNEGLKFLVVTDLRKTKDFLEVVFMYSAAQSPLGSW
jgi:hypothetical protein